MAYAVAQQTQEIGIRMALGASRTDVLRVIVSRGFVLSGIGVGIGLAASFVLSRLLTRFLYGISPLDPAVFSLVALLLIAVATTASYLPARRAVRVDPMSALRYE
jgi:putative ABC transport system permease protein